MTDNLNEFEEDNEPPVADTICRWVFVICLVWVLVRVLIDNPDLFKF